MAAPAPTTDSKECTWGTATWESENLLRLQQVNKELRAAAAEDLWAPLLGRLEEQHPFGEDGHGDCIYPMYPERIHGAERDRHSFFPHAQDSEACSHVPALVLPMRACTRFDEATRDVEGKFYLASEDAGLANDSTTSIWLKRPPALLRCERGCEPCGALSFECGRSFKEHCCSWKHCQLMLRPELRLPEELWDPRWKRQDWAALTPLGRYKAIHLHVETVMALFNAPMDEEDMERMQYDADTIMSDLALHPGISEEERAEAAARCTAMCSNADALAAAVRKHLLIPKFNQFGIVNNGSCAYLFLVQGWQTWELDSWITMCIALTGLDVDWPGHI